MSNARLFLIDAHTLCYRSFFAIKNLTTSTGQATNAVYGFVNTMRKILREFHPEYVAVCFDSKGKTLRQEKFKEYKIQRPKMPDDLISQIPIIKDVVRAYNLPIFELDGYEADDLIATLAKKAAEHGIEVVIVTEDKDMYQLMGKNVKIFSSRKDALLDYEDVKKLLGIEPTQIVDYIGLAGDNSDNIPGVKGIGEVTARQLINQFGSLENIFKHVEDVKAVKVKEKLVDQKESAILSKELAILDSRVPIEVDVDLMKIKAPNNNRLFELFKNLEFMNMAKEFASGASSSEAVESVRLSSSKDIDGLMQAIAKKKQFAFLLKVAESEEERFCEGAWVSAGHEVYFMEAKKLKLLKEPLEDKKVLKIAYNIKESLHTLAEFGLTVEGPVFDVLLAGYLISPAQAAFDLKGLVWTHFNADLPDQSEAAVKYVFDLHPILEKELNEKSLIKLFREIELPLAIVLFKMEHEGVKLDLDLLQSLSKECELKIQTITKDLYRISGEEFNLNSPKQLSHILFEKLKLPVVKKTKTGFSTDEEVLNKLASKHEVPALILSYRQLAKLKSTYLDALPQLVNKKTGRIHARFNQAGAETGRLSSNNPNLQNIPIRTELGSQIRKAFIPFKDGHVIISADYSQIELRILADLSKDENLLKAFTKGEDIHKYTAALVFEVPEDKVDYHMRDTAKRVNFGIIYGMSAFGLSKDLGISPGEAQDFIDRYFLRYPKVKKFMDDSIAKCQEQGYVTTLFNRRRYIPEIHSKNVSVRQFAERQAINTPVQGSAADLIKLAMINIQNEIESKPYKGRMIITVHDELVFDCPKAEEPAMTAMIKDKMEHVIKLSVPIQVSVNVGKNWLETKEVK